MKKKILLIFTILFVSIITAQSRQESYRWRNDNGTEASATWKANKNVPSVPDNIGIPFRLRIQVQRGFSPFSQGDFDTHPFQYRKNGGAWVSISTNNSNDLYFINSAFVTDFTTTTQQISTTNYDTGRFKSSNSNSFINLTSGRSTEIEYSIARSSSYDASSSYEFRIEDLSSFTVYPRLDPIATHLNFDGVNDFVTLQNESNFDFTNQMTVEVWMNSNVTTPDQWDALVVKGDNSWRLHLNVSGTVDFTCSGVAATGAVSNTSVTDGNWHHIAGVLDGNSVKIYIDGTLETEIVGAGILNNSSFPVIIGNNPEYGGRNFTGNIDDIRIWNVARTANQINGSKDCELQGSETGLVAYYKFNQGGAGVNNSGITNLIDATANANNGTLSNFGLTGSTSNWLAGSPVTTGSIIPSAPTVTTPVTYTQGDTASPLTATSGTNGTGLLWYTSATGGTGSTNAPTPSTTTVGSTSYWVSSTNANGCESERVEMVVTVNPATPATHLNFDGVNDRIQVPSIINLANTSFTLEFYAKRTLSNTNDYVFNQGVFSANNNLHIGFRGDNVFLFNFYSNDLNVSPANYVSDNAWHHWACVYNIANGTRQVYQDGILVASQSGVSPYTGIGFLQIGSQNSQHFFDGNLDDIRIWNVAKTADQINAGKNCELEGNETGLLAYYNFNQGLDAQNNSSQTTLIDATANSNNGTLTNFGLTGSTSNWLAGSPVTTGSIIPSATTVTTPVTYNQGATATALTATPGTNGTGLFWYTSATGGTGSITAPTPSTATVGSTSYWVSSTNANGCESERVEMVVTVNAATPATHLNFDGVNDFVTANVGSVNLQLNNYTHELWFRTSSPTGTLFNNAGSGNANAGAHNKVLLLVNGKLRSYVYNGAGSFIESTTNYNDGNWHHVAEIVTTSQRSLYVDGTLIGTSNNLASQNLDYITLGNSNQTPVNYFNGDIDEVRIWNTAKTLDQINASKNCELLGTETDLVLYYKFNQGIDLGDNTSENTLTDVTANAYNGTLNNFTLTGSTSNWLAGSPIISGSVVPSIPTVTTPITYNQGDTASPLTAASGTNGTGLLWYTSATGGIGSTTAPTPSTTTVGSTSYWVSSTNSNGCESERVEMVVTVNAATPATHLNFDGSNDFVNIANLITSGSSYTKQAMIRPTNISSSAGHNILSNSNEVFWIWSGNIRAGNSGNFQHVFADASSLLNTWNMVTVTYDAPTTTMKLYINETLVNENNSVSATIGGNMQIGAFGSGAVFNGDIDEVRIWNRALTIAEISNNANCELQAGDSSLLAYYKFNQGNSGVSNTGVTTLTDASGNSNNGTLSGFALNGTTSNWLAGSSITTGSSCPTLSTSNFDLAQTINLYPNPSKGNLTVVVPKNGNSKISIYDMNGRLLLNTVKNTKSYNLDLSTYTPGIYILKIEINGNEIIKKIIRE